LFLFLETLNLCFDSKKGSQANDEGKFESADMMMLRSALLRRSGVRSMSSLPATMQAVCFVEPFKVETRQVATPAVESPTDVVLRITLSAICGSDLHPYRGAEVGLDEGTVMGHEFVGVVAAKGEAVELEIGARVCVPFTTNCGECFFCKCGLTCRCDQGQLFGWVETHGGVVSGLHGGQAEYVRVPLADATCVPVPPTHSDEQALLLGDILSTGFHCAKGGDLQEGGACVVVGCGPVGLMAVASAKALCPSGTVIAVDGADNRLQMAKSLGADHVLSDLEGAVAAVKELTGGRGADSVLEIVGSKPAMALAFAAMRPGGTLSSVGVHAYETAAWSPVDAYDSNITFRAGRCPARAVMSEAKGVFDSLGSSTWTNLQQIVTHRVSLAEAPALYEQFNQQAPGTVKVLLLPDGGSE